MHSSEMMPFLSSKKTLLISFLHLSSTQDTASAEEQPDRVVLIEDLRPFLFSLSQPASLRCVLSHFFE